MKKNIFGGLKDLLKKSDTIKPANKNFARPSFLKNFADKLEWDQIINRLFLPESRPGIHKFFLISLIATSTYSAGKIVSLTASNFLSEKIQDSKTASTSRETGKTTRLNSSKIKTANIFNAKSSSDTTKKVENNKKVHSPKLKCTESKVSSSLPLKLKNTIVLQDSVKSVAAVQVRSTKNFVKLREGDIVPGIAKISKIFGRKVIIKNLKSGACEFIENKEKGPKSLKGKSISVVSPSKGKKLMEESKIEGIENTGNHFTISKDRRSKLLDDVGSILTQAKGTPIRNSDGTMSFKISDVVPGGIFSHLNIQDGDIIESINGKKIQNLNEVMDLFGRIRDVDNLQIGLKRDGEEQNQEYTFK